MSIRSCYTSQLHFSFCEFSLSLSLTHGEQSPKASRYFVSLPSSRPCNPFRPSSHKACIKGLHHHLCEHSISPPPYNQISTQQHQRR